MLMIGTSELAKRLYEKWRERQDRMAPLPIGIDKDGHWKYGSHATRPKWEHLTTIQQDVWKDVASAACNVLVEAMGAVPAG